MAKNKKKKPNASERRSLRTQQILFGLLAFLMILSMVVSLIAK